MGTRRGLNLLSCIGLFCLILNTDVGVRAQKHAKRATSARITSSRSFGTNVKHSSSSNGGNTFDCPEEFGYYPHPTDCSQYYVCVFGGALLESCTGGLMYSHELQTCDWPRNVGCEVVDSGPSASSNSNGQREASGRSIKQQQSTLNQHVPSRVRFGSAFTSPAATSTSTSASYDAPRPTVPQQYHRQPPQTIQAQVQTIPPPTELKVPQSPVITSRGEPKTLLDSQEDIAQLYADAHDTLPVEEEETDRQQRVYRGQPSTVSQVQRDRDGILHQASLNAIPNHGKIGSFAFGSHYRDIEYQQQSPPPQQYQQPIRQQQSTYRPLEILTTPTPPQQQQQQQHIPLRDTSYNNKAQQQSSSPLERPTYSNQQALIYNTDYDEDLLAQIEQDNAYDQPTRSPVRAEQVTIRTLDSAFRFPPTSPPEAIFNDARHYYRTIVTEALTTTTEEAPHTELPTYSYSVDTSDEHNNENDNVNENDDEQVNENVITEKPFYQQPTRYTTTYRPRLISTQKSDEYSVINDSSTFARESTKPAITFTTNAVRSTTKMPTTPKPRFIGTTRTTYQQTRPSTTSTFSTSRRTTATPIRINTTPKSVTQLVRTTATPTTTSTTKPSRTNSNNRNRGSSHYSNQDRDLPVNTNVNNNRGTHPPRTRPTLKPSGTIVSKAQEFVDIYRYPPTRPDPLYPQPTPDKTAAKCRRDVCLLPDCSCGGRDIPGNLTREETPQTVLITYDDAVSELNYYMYQELFNNETRKNPNGCPIRTTLYVSHEWTNYGMVQDLYADGHEMASHSVSHSFGEQFSQKKWTREIAGQREILAAYGGVKLSDVRGMRAPFLSVGGNKMYKMLYDSNFTYDSSMPVYENRPPSWPYTLDYKIFHDCMIPPCPTRSYPGVWQVPMVMWQDLNGGRCSMGDACSNPSDADGVYKMIMKNFERHYTTNRAPFGLFYHAAWFTQPHHKQGFIKFLDAINAMPDVWIVTNWQMLQWVRDPTPISRINSFQPFQCDYSDRPKRCNNPKVCNLWHKSGVRYMKTCQPCPDIYPWTGKTGIRSSRIDNDIEDST